MSGPNHEGTLSVRNLAATRFELLIRLLTDSDKRVRLRLSEAQEFVSTQRRNFDYVLRQRIFQGSRHQH
jgi:spermidine synthase